MKSSRLNKFLEQQLYQSLSLALASDNPQKTHTILQDLTTTEEIERLAKRLAIAVYLDKGRSYDNIRQNLQVSANEIAWVGKRLGNPGIQAALLEIKAEQWAETWTRRIIDTIKKVNS